MWRRSRAACAAPTTPDSAASPPEDASPTATSATASGKPSPANRSQSPPPPPMASSTSPTATTTSAPSPVRNLSEHPSGTIPILTQGRGNRTVDADVVPNARNPPLPATQAIPSLQGRGIRVAYPRASSLEVRGTSYEVRATSYEVRATRYELRGTRYAESRSSPHSSGSTRSRHASPAPRRGARLLLLPPPQRRPRPSSH